MTHIKLGQYWPWDFDLHGRISPRRDSWGAEYIGNPEMREQGLGGGKEVPSWTDPGLPLTYTSSHKIMTAEVDAMKTTAAIKRKAEDKAVPKVRIPVKRPRRGSMSAELQKMKEAAEMKRRSTETEEDRYSGGIPEFRHAIQIVNATEAQNQSAALETMVLTNETQDIKDMDEMFNEWLADNQAQRTKAHRLFEAHIAGLKTRDTRIVTLEAEVQRSRTLVERQKQKLKTRNAHLATAKRRWAQQRVFLECKYKAIQQIARDIDEQVRVDFSNSVLDGDGSNYGAEAEDDEEDTEKIEIEEDDEDEIEGTRIEEQIEETIIEDKDKDEDEDKAEETETEQQIEETGIEDDNDKDEDDEEDNEKDDEKDDNEKDDNDNDNEESAGTVTEDQPEARPEQTAEPNESQPAHERAPIKVNVINPHKTDQLRIRFKGPALFDELIRFRVQGIIRGTNEADDNDGVLPHREEEEEETETETEKKTETKTEKETETEEEEEEEEEDEEEDEEESESGPTRRYPQRKRKQVQYSVGSLV